MKKIFHPELYQGDRKKDNYFEGWYYKLVSEDQKTSIAFIPGISKNQDDPHAFIQVFLSIEANEAPHLLTDYVRFPITDFRYSHETFMVGIGHNTFTIGSLEVDLKTRHGHIKGRFKLDGTKKIKTSLLSPNVMGFFGYLSFMECYHGIISMSHHLEGTLQIGDQAIVFDHGKGYIEKDWGRSFPKAYVWIQSNHFKNPNTSFLFSYADIPFVGFTFKGLIVNLLIDNKEYRFATYNGAKVKKEIVAKDRVAYTIKRGRHTLEIDAHATNSVDLASPRNGRMIETIKEGLSGVVSIKLSIGSSLIYEDLGTSAGIEIMTSMSH
jgi:tocopherol cyclase